MKFGIIKRVALALTVLLCLSATLTSCAVSPIKSTEEEAAVVGNIGKFEVRYEELRYLVLNFKQDMALKYGEDIWTDPAKAEQYKDELWERVSDKIVSDYYAIQAMADFYYVGGGSALMMTEKPILDAVQETVELTVKEVGGKKKYKELLASQYLTDNLFRFYTAAETCATELFYILVQDLGIIESSDEYIDAYFESDDFIRTNHIFLEGVTEENYEIAKSLRDTLATSENKEMEMIMLKGIHCDDYTMTTVHGKYFARYTSDYGEEYETAAFGLNIGQLSDIVETDKGYYVILRLEPETDYISKNYDTFKDDILGSEFNKILASYKEDLDFTLNDYGKSINILEIE